MSRPAAGPRRPRARVESDQPRRQRYAAGADDGRRAEGLDRHPDGARPDAPARVPRPRFGSRPIPPIASRSSSSTTDQRRIRRAEVQLSYPGARVIRNATNIGFAAGNNAGAAAATGEYLVFLNDDTRVHPDWLRELVATARRRGAAAVASRILDWSGRADRFRRRRGELPGQGVSARLRRAGRQPDPGGKAAAVRLRLRHAGRSRRVRRRRRWDEGAFAYYEDVELGWRLNLLGHEVWFAPAAVVYHKHHGTSGRWPEPPRLRLYERNSLRMLYSLLDTTSLERVLPAALLLAVEKALLASKLARPMTGRRRSPGVLTFLEGDSAQPRHHQDDDRAPDARASGCRRALRSRKGRPGVAASGRSCRCAGRLTTSNLTRPPPGSSRNRSRSIRRRRWPGSTHSCLEFPSSVSAVPPFNPSDASPTRTWSSTFGGHWVNPGPVPFQLEYNAVHALLVRQFAIEALKVRPAVGGGIEARGRRAP